MRIHNLEKYDIKKIKNLPKDGRDCIIYNIPKTVILENRVENIPFHLTEKKAREIVDAILSDSELMNNIRSSAEKAELNELNNINTDEECMDRNLVKIGEIVKNYLNDVPYDVISWFSIITYAYTKCEKDEMIKSNHIEGSSG